MAFETAVEIPPELRVIGAARRIVRSDLDRWEATVDQEVVLLLVTELITNALLHGAPPVELRVRWEPPVLRVAVWDAAVDALPRPVVASPEDTGGRGLHLVASLADDWDVEVGGRAKQVWFELRA